MGNNSFDKFFNERIDKRIKKSLADWTKIQEILVELKRNSETEKGHDEDIKEIFAFMEKFVERIKQLTTSSSNCNYGAIIPSNLVSLNPSIKKAMSVTNIRFTPFDDVIRLIIEKLSHNIPSLND